MVEGARLESVFKRSILRIGVRDSFSPVPSTALSPRPKAAQIENLNEIGVRLWADAPSSRR